MTSKFSPIYRTALLPLFALGCSAQAAPDYPGDPLLTISGKVVIDNPEAPSELVPALAFVAGRRNSTHFLIEDVSVEGRFPAGFTVDVLRPPPEEALVSLARTDAEEPRIAWAYLTAVTPEHPKSIQPAKEIRSSACQNLTPGAVDPVSACYEEHIRCASDYDYANLGDPDNSACFHERLNCDDNGQNCTPGETWGNPAYEKSLWQNFAGISTNYVVLYLEKPSHEASFVTWMFGAGRPLSAGYHLIRATQTTPEESAEASQCASDVNAAFLAEYNAGHGTSFTEVNAVTKADPAAIKRYLETTAAHQCTVVVMDTKYTPVESGPEHPVSIDIGKDVSPAFGGLFLDEEE